MSVKDKMHSGEIYDPNDPKIAKEQLKCLDMLYDFNQTRPTEQEKRQKMLKEMFAATGAISSRRFTQTGQAATCISAKMCMRIST